MGRSRLENERLDRLASEVRRGGGLPLPLLFGGLLEELLDNGPTGDERLVRITSEVLSGKTAKLAETWDGSWEKLADDALQQLQSEGLVARNGDGLWRVGEKFRAGKNLRTIPARKGLNAADHVTVWEKAEREARSRASYLEAEAAASIGAGRIRPVDSSHAADLRRSASEIGYIYPVVKDQYGRVLDGGHRLEADPDWPFKKIPVRDDQHALAISLDANRGKPLPPKVQARVTELIGDLAGTNQIKRDRVKAALLADPSRSDRDVGRRVGCNHSTVNVVRRDLEENGEISHFEFGPGRGRTTGVPAEPRPPVLTADVQAQVTAGVADGAITSETDVRDMFDLKVAAAKTALRTARAVVNDRQQREQAPEPEFISEPEPEHVHDLGPRFRECIECGERVEEDD
jgi:hypothetical protein